MTSINSSRDIEDYFDASQIDVGNFAPHISEKQGSAPNIPDESKLQFIKICAVGNSTDADNKTYSVYYIEVNIKASPLPSWYVYRRYSQFRKLSDSLRSDGYYVPVLPPKQQSFGEVKADAIRKRKSELEGWIRSLSEQTIFHSNAKDPQTSMAYRQFLLENANSPPSPLIRVFPENMLLRSTVDNRQESYVQKPYVKVWYDLYLKSFIMSS